MISDYNQIDESQMDEVICRPVPPERHKWSHANKASSQGAHWGDYNKSHGMMPHKLERGLDLEMNAVGSLNQDICSGENGNIGGSHSIIPACNDGRKGTDIHIYQKLLKETMEPIQNPCESNENIHTNRKTCAVGQKCDSSSVLRNDKRLQMALRLIAESCQHREQADLFFINVKEPFKRTMELSLNPSPNSPDDNTEYEPVGTNYQP